MGSIEIIVWEEDGAWLGSLRDYPDYRTQGETLDDLRTHLGDLHRDLAGGGIRGIRRRVENLLVW